ncbi:MAG TPA: cobyric acid synthase, partial [bacterium]|nr:cobyric acid synthase [bacterium]
AVALMLQGTGSHVGKSVLVAALGRCLLQDGWWVAPFKAQNMALNSFVTADGGEMGRAQVTQAQACRLAPRVMMNPVLLKPSGDAQAQVIVMGKPWGNLSAAAYHTRKTELLGVVGSALAELRRDYEVVVIEGAGSPAEINLREQDIVNMTTAHLADAPVVLVGDIDRGGVFASLYGTLALLAERDRARIKGFIINKFRGDVELLKPGLRMLEEKTGLPVLGVMPYLREMRLPEEDSVNFETRREVPAGEGQLAIAVLYLPHISNFTDFDPFDNDPAVALRYLRPGEPLPDADLVIIPGTKNTMDDFAYLVQAGYADGLRARVAAGKPVFGICGGYQMLGTRLTNPHGLEGDTPQCDGLGVLDLVTELAEEKTLRQVTATHVPTGAAVRGYEIHHGVSQAGAGDTVLFAAGDRVLGSARRDGRAGGTYLHGVFDNDEYRAGFINELRARRGWPAQPARAFERDREFDRLAETFRTAIDLPRLYALAGLSR